MLAGTSRQKGAARPLSIALVTVLCVTQNLALSGTEDYLLTGTGVFHFTNVARRSASNLEPLVEAAGLNAVAQTRLKDMFDRQYFGHSAPGTQEGAAEIADRIGYEYLSIAENIARGSFANDQDMVRVWMESGRHRQNILSPGYSQIGVAVGRGTLGGQLMWIGVQVFARPRSACPQPDPWLGTRIDALKSEAAAVKSRSAALLAQLGSPDRRNRDEVTRYNGRAMEYNALIARHNALADEVRRLAAVHNLHAEQLASCVRGTGM